MKNIFKAIRPWVVKNEPEILMSLGLAGMIFATVYSIKATVDATHAVDKIKAERNVEKLPAKDIIKNVWKYYIPSAVSTVISIPCIIAGNRVSSTRNAALAAAYTLSETALQEYQEKTKEIVRDKKENEIREEIAKDKVKKTYENSTVILTGDGDSLFYEPLSGRYFKSNWNRILKAANELNADAIGGSDIIRLSDWFDSLGLDQTDISDRMGWSIYKHGSSGLVSVDITSCLTPDNVPCGAIRYNNEPEYLDY